MPKLPHHLVMFASVVNLETERRMIDMINRFCEAGMKVSVICRAQSIDNEEDLARSLHKSAAVYRLPEYFPEQCDLAESFGYSFSTLPQRLYLTWFCIGRHRLLDGPIEKLPGGARQLFQAVADA